MTLAISAIRQPNTRMPPAAKAIKPNIAAEFAGYGVTQVTH